MLHEILLSLSGLHSPIWDQLRNEGQAETSLNEYTSPPERAMLNVLAELSELHIKVRDLVTTISRSHPSPTCRAVVNRIGTKHLRAFTSEIIEVEASILQESAQFVGAYKIVPLSTIVSRFQPWTRPMRWLYKTLQQLSTFNPQNPSFGMTGAALLEYLRKECHTGYSDLKETASDLLVVAQKSWLQTLMPWILYGQLPSLGKEDFMISVDFSLIPHCIPYFVAADTADIVLAIGKALLQVKSQGRPYQNMAFASNACNTLMSATLEHIDSLEYPLESTTFHDFTEKVNANISQNILAQLMSKDSIVELLLIIQDYLLLRNGEFSTLLIEKAAEHMDHQKNPGQTARPLHRAGKTTSADINRSHADIILSKTWSDLTAITPELELDNPAVNKAVAWLRLKMNISSIPISTLLPLPSCICIEFAEDSPLRIFITQKDISLYQNLNAYLISLNRAQSQLTQLWRSSAHRRCHPMSIRPPRGKSQEMQKVRNIRKERRDRKMRSHWICVSRILLVLSELCNFLHGDVIKNSWDCLSTWLNSENSIHPSSSKSSSRPTIASSEQMSNMQSKEVLGGSTTIGTPINFRRDPRLLAAAHRKYLDALYHSVLLDNAEYVAALRSAFNTIDHYVALFYRIQTVWQELDLRTDEKLLSAFTDLPKEEEEVLKELERTRITLADQTHELVESIGQVERQRGMAGIDREMGEFKFGRGNGERHQEFRAWNVRTLNPLLMKLDFMMSDREDEFEDAVPDVLEDKS